VSVRHIVICRTKKKVKTDTAQMRLPFTTVGILLTCSCACTPQIPKVQFDARPVQIREGKQDRALLKLARKKIHHHVSDLAVFAILSVQKSVTFRFHLHLHSRLRNAVIKSSKMLRCRDS
jgi:hypothetical protein